VKKQKNKLEAREKGFWRELEKVLSDQKDVENLLKITQNDFKIKTEEMKREK